MPTLILLISILLTACSCVGIKYENDLGFLNSAQANSLELFVKIGNSICKDMDGKIGVCSKQVVSTQDLTFYHVAMPYAYRFTLTCSKDLGADFSRDIPASTEFKFDIKAAQFASVKSFICIGEVYPKDGRDQVSAKWEVRVKVVDSQYVGREDIYLLKYKGDDYLVLGQNARYARVWHDGYWNRYENKPYVKLKKTDGVQAYSESYQMRYNYFNYTAVK